MALADYTLSVQQAINNEERRRMAGSAAILLLAEWVVWAWIHNIQRLLRYYTPVPYLDYWRTALLLRFYQTFQYHVFWLQHNEHRIFCQEIVFATDYLLLHGRQVLPIALSLACYLASWVVLAWAFGSDARVPGRVRVTGVLLAGVVLGWEGSAVVLVNPFLLQWTLPTIAAILSLWFIVRLKETGNNAYLSAVIVAAAIATYSSGNGILVWPIVIGGALMLSIGRGKILVIACSGTVLIGIYFIGYRFTKSLSVMNLVRHPVYLLQFIGSYLAMPFSAVTPYWLGSALGIAAMCATAGLAVIAARAGLAKTRAGIVLFGTYLYMVLTALMIAAGRMDPAQVGIGNAKYSRYVIEPLMAWAVLVLLCVWVCSRSVRRAVWAYAIVAAFGALALIGFSRLGGWLGERDVEFANVQLGAVAVQNGVFDRTAVLYLFPWKPENVQIWSEALRQNGLSVFYKGYWRALGHPVSGVRPLAAGVPGEVTEVTPVTGGVEVVGWADWAELRQTGGWVLLANESGEMVGLGRRLPAGLPMALRNGRTPERLSWVGFVNAKYQAASVRAYVVSKRGLLPLEGSVAVPIYHTNG